MAFQLRWSNNSSIFVSRHARIQEFLSGGRGGGGPGPSVIKNHWLLFSSPPLILQNANGLYNFPRFQRSFNIFSRVGGGGGGYNFSRGRSNCLFPIESHITCVFPGGPGPLPRPPSGSVNAIFGSTGCCDKSKIWEKVINFDPPPPPPWVSLNVYMVSGKTTIMAWPGSKLFFPGSDNFGSNPLYFSFCIKTLPDMSSAGNLCKQFGPGTGPTFCSGLIGSKLFDTL